MSTVKLLVSLQFCYFNSARLNPPWSDCGPGRNRQSLIRVEHATPPSYQDVHVPLLIIAGEEDKSAPLKGCEYILREVGSTDKRLEVLKGVGHWHCVEAGDEVGKLVREFCDGLKK